MQNLYYGDCLEILPKLQGTKIDCIIADLPYQLLNKRACWDTIIPIDEM